MCDTEVCRLCAVLVDATNSNKLFMRCRQKLLLQIEELTGLKLEHTRDLPQLICATCQKQTQQAHEFRERCIQVQQELTTQKCLNQIKELHDAEDEGEVISTEIDRIAEETDDDEEEEEHYIDGYERDEEKNVLLPISKVLIKRASTADCSSEEEITLLTDDLDTDAETDANTKNAESRHIRKQKKRGRPILCESVLRERKNLYRRTRNFICDHCGKSCTNRTNFVRHQLRHGDRQFKCEFCTEKFFTKPDLKSHIRVHTGEKPYACRYCGKCFGNSTTRSVHERIHTKECPFVCQECGKSYRSSGELHRHTLTHSEQRPFGCNICNLTFTVNKYLKQHYRCSMHKQNEEKLQTTKQVEKDKFEC